MARSSSPDTATAILRERTQARTSTATTAVTARPIHPPYSNVTTVVARSSNPATITAILPDRCPARAAWTARMNALVGAATNSRTPVIIWFTSTTSPRWLYAAARAP